MNPHHKFPEQEGIEVPELVPVEHEPETPEVPIAIINSVLERINEEDWDGEEDGGTPQKPTLH